jgi:glutathione S-transferase
MLTLYHGRTSVCSIKARLALAEKGVDWDGKLLTLRGDQFDPGYMKLNPNAVVPTVVHDGNVIIESTVIMHYVDEVFPGPSLLPSDPVGRSRLRLTTKLMDEYVHVSCMTITFATANRASLARLSPHDMEAELAKAPDPKRSQIKRQVVAKGLDAPPVVEALRQQGGLDREATQEAPYRRARLVAGGRGGDAMSGSSTSSSSRACGGPARRALVTTSARGQFKTAVEDWMTPVITGVTPGPIPGRGARASQGGVSSRV